MMKQYSQPKMFMILLLVLSLGGCTGASPTPIQTQRGNASSVQPTDASTQIPTATPTEAPTQTPEPTLTPTPQENLEADDESSLSEVKPGEKVILNKDVRLDGLPYSVVPYGSQPALAFTDLKLDRNGDTLQGKANFARQGQGDFTLVVYLSMADELLIGYLDAESNFTLNMPGGMVLFGANGYRLSGDQTGTIEFSLSARVFNGYDISGQKGTVYLFAVPGTVNPQSILPGDQTDPETYQANSNVVESGFDF